MGVYSSSLIIKEQDGEGNTLETYYYVEKYSRLKEIFDAVPLFPRLTNAVNVVVSGDDIESTDKRSEYVIWTLDKGWGPGQLIMKNFKSYLKKLMGMG